MNSVKIMKFSVALNCVKIKKFPVTLNCVKIMEVSVTLNCQIMMLLVILNYQIVISKQKLLKVVSNLKTNSLLGILLGMARVEPEVNTNPVSNPRLA